MADSSRSAVPAGPKASGNVTGRTNEHWYARTPWTEARIAKLKALWAEGNSASIIAALLGGITKNSVIGKISRLGLQGRGKPTHTGRRQRAREQHMVRRIASGPPRCAAPVVVKPPTVPAPPPLNISLFELTGKTCRWPTFGERDATRYCGHPPKPDKPYCQAHCDIAYVEIDPRRQRLAA